MPEEPDESFDGGLGTLTITAEGEARFVGSFAGSEYLQGEEQAGQHHPQPGSGLATPPSSATAPRFLIGRPVGMLDTLGMGQATIKLENLRDHLPNWEDEGRLLIETYWENVNWM